MKNKKKIIIAIVTILLGIAAGIFGINYTDEDVNKIADGIETVTNIIENNASTIEIPELTENEEQTLEVQNETEIEGLKEQGELSYNGDYISENVTLGDYAGLTYYSQVDSRWKNHLYTSIGDKNQTIGTSGCGPTSASMVVSSIKGIITPEIMGDLFVANGYRSANNGTYLAAFRWVADFFNIEYSHTTSVDTMVNNLRNNNYVIASCGSGLFTYGGHLITITGIEGDTLKVYDPYLYNGKFDTSTRRGKASVSGNTVYVSIENFKRYANATNFYCYKNDRTDIKDNTTTPIINNNITSNVINVNYQVKVTAKSGLNIRSGASTSYSKIGGYAKNTIVTILAESNGWGKTNKGWIHLGYTNKIQSNINVNNNKYTTGNYKVTASILNVRSGPGTNYKVKTYKQLTSNARNQNKKLGNFYTNGYRRGTVCTVSKISGSWGLTPSGWICLTYANKI
ncbi:MAG: SH3 domain-containing protein [Clostridia bacterium]